MHWRAQKLFYVLAIFVLMNALFVMQGRAAESAEVRSVKQEIKQHFRLAFWQTIGDQPLFEGVEIAVRGVDSFYAQAAGELLVLLEPTPYEDGLGQVLAGMWNLVKGERTFGGNSGDEEKIAALLAAGKFMQEEPLLNIIPYDGNPKFEIRNSNQISNFQFPISNPIILGESIEPVNGFNEWVTIQDNYTGQLYCLAIYNNVVNRYLGACKRDE